MLVYSLHYRCLSTKFKQRYCKDGRLQTYKSIIGIADTLKSRYPSIMTITQCSTRYDEYLTLHNTIHDNFSHVKIHFFFNTRERDADDAYTTSARTQMATIRNLSNDISILVISKLSILTAQPHPTFSMPRDVVFYVFSLMSRGRVTAEVKTVQT